MTNDKMRETVASLKERVLQFQMLQLPGQPMMMHMGISYLVSDLWSALQEANAALAAIGITDETGWQTMDSAPKDGTLVDMWIGGEFPGRRTDVSWRNPTDNEWWVHGGDTIETPDATWHDCFGPLGEIEPPIRWRPLPAPPAAAQEGEQ